MIWTSLSSGSPTRGGASSSCASARKDSVEKHGGGIDDRKALEHLLRALAYIDGDYNDPGTFSALRRAPAAPTSTGVGATGDTTRPDRHPRFMPLEHPPEGARLRVPRHSHGPVVPPSAEQQQPQLGHLESVGGEPAISRASLRRVALGLALATASAWWRSYSTFRLMTLSALPLDGPPASCS